MKVELKWRCGKRRKAPLLTDAQRKKRLLFAPQHRQFIQSRQHSLSPWFNADCRALRWQARRLERVYRRTRRTRRLGSNSSGKCMQPIVTENENTGRPLLSSSPKI